ncbi:hypothetical protein EVAR_97435_1 [Eumeta japonica]|uniref:Uncharacterized protein n=1 Tax=Eumeta variegata TaxID=151549 RepID=A0A4C1X0Y4_EUMVA|nr:hypothetical protein EVAR_97435_1 [Eumeta japonica]
MAVGGFLVSAFYEALASFLRVFDAQDVLPTCVSFRDGLLGILENLDKFVSLIYNDDTAALGDVVRAAARPAAGPGGGAGRLNPPDQTDN